MKSLPTYLVALALTAPLVGCGTLIGPYDISAPDALPAGVDGHINADGSTTLQLADMKIDIDINNLRPGGVALAWFFAPWIAVPIPVDNTAYREPDQLIIAFEFRTASAGFALDPTAVVVTLPDGRSMTPTDLAAGCTPHTQWSGIGAAIELPCPNKTQRRILLGFAAQVTADSGFSLTLGGIYRDGHPVAVPAIEFSKHRAHSLGLLQTEYPVPRGTSDE